ncbi:hypothetical protein ACIHCQ_29780 [Streptomyces sp. NPDC052236]|uniref:hypothetical protein n=1 Tax=Streptomyces sp. NPDC052236 TaxID=3365686 RepID=UPI0037D00CA0
MSLITDRPAPPAPQSVHGPHGSQIPPTGGRAAARRARSRRARRPASLTGRYVGYVLYFVGAGLISGAVVHHPLDPDRYTMIGVIGVMVFLAATVINEFILVRNRPALPRMAVVIGASLLLSFGIGMLGGGLQHFDDFPARGAVLVPLGIAVSFVAFVIKDAETSWRRIFSPVGLGVLLAVIVSFFGLRSIADSMGEAPEGGGHSHGTETTEESDEHGAEEESPAPASESTAPQTGTEPSESAEAESGEAEDGHSH